MIGKESLVPKQTDNLDARLEETVAAAPKPTRRNWQKEPWVSYMKRAIESWTNKKDLWQEGESKEQFLKRLVCLFLIAFCYELTTILLLYSVVTFHGGPLIANCKQGQRAMMYWQLLSDAGPRRCFPTR